MRFAFVLTNLSGGGAEKAVLKIGAGLAARGHDVHVILLEARTAHETPPGIHLHALAPRVSRGIIGKWRAARRLRSAIARLGRFDLIVSTLPFADEIAVRARLPRHWCRIANTLSAEIARLPATKAARRRARYRRIYEARRLIAVSDGVASDLRGPLGLARATIERIYNPFDFAAMRTQAAENAPVPSEPYVIHVGRFVGQKRHDVLLDAWRSLDDAPKLVLLADADPQLAAMIEARGLAERVFVAGFQPNPYPWLARARLLVLSSDHEGLPNVIIEALALGVPVVSTDCPSGPREILGQALPECLVPVGDAPALARTIRRMLAAPPAPERVDLARFDAATVLNAYERLCAASSA